MDRERSKVSEKQNEKEKKDDSAGAEEAMPEDAAGEKSEEKRVYEIPEVKGGASLEEALREAEKHLEKKAKKKKRPRKKVSKEAEEEINKLKDKICDLEAQASQLKDKWLRALAEFENYRKRSRKEWELLKQQTKADVVIEMLHVLDDFERAFAVVEGEGELVQGFRMIYEKLLLTLTKLGVREIEALDAPFDPNYHMAVAQREEAGKDSGVVVEVAEKGYLLDDSLLRPAKVIVAK